MGASVFRALPRLKGRTRGGKNPSSSPAVASYNPLFESEASMSRKVGVVLSGCGYLDGSEIHEAVAILIALDRLGAEVVAMAPDAPQAGVVNHLTGQPEQTPRNMLVESARIARGKVRDIRQVNAGDLDALIFPGGYGAAKNLSTFATEGVHCQVNEDVARLLRDMHEVRKPIGLACISPVIAARIFGTAGVSVRLTVGADAAVAQAINRMGARHRAAAPAEICIDREHRIVSTPCYMNEVGPWIVYQGAESLVEEIMRLADEYAASHAP